MDLVERAFASLEDGDWKTAEAYCDEALAEDPGNPQAHLGKLLADLQIRTMDGLKDCSQRFDNRMSYRNGLPFFGETLQAQLEGCIAHINRRNEAIRLEQAYLLGKNAMTKAVAEEDFLSAARQFSMIRRYENAAELEQICLELAEGARKDAVLSEAAKHMAEKLPGDYEIALKMLESIAGWKDADRKAAYCRHRIEQFHRIVETEQLTEERRALRRRTSLKKIAVFGIPVLCAAAVLTVLLLRLIVPGIRYSIAMEKLRAGDPVAAYEIFAALGSYKDSVQQAEAIRIPHKAEKAKQAKVGSYIELGTYRQFVADSDRGEDVSWRVLAVEDGRALVVSLYSLDCKQFHKTPGKVTWADCDLRQWLNGTFLETVFTPEETAVIAEVSHDGVKDKVFLLSLEEAERYFASDLDRRCEATAYAESQGAWIRKANRGSWWWLRSAGTREGFIARVGTNGDISTRGNPPTFDYLVVRPAMWIDLEP